MPSSPSSLPSALVLLFAVACGLSVANVYYAQPLLDVLGAEFAIGQAGVGLLFGATQAGCALALLLVVPLGDLLERRRLMFVQLLLLVLSLLLVGFAGDTLGLALGLLGLGLLGTAMTQGLLAYAAALAAPGERGRVVGAAQGGVVIGLLLARSLAGLLADLGGWRSVYLVSAASMGGLGLLLWRVLGTAGGAEQRTGADLPATARLDVRPAGEPARAAGARPARAVDVRRLRGVLEQPGIAARRAAAFAVAQRHRRLRPGRRARRAGRGAGRQPGRSRPRPGAQRRRPAAVAAVLAAARPRRAFAGGADSRRAAARSRRPGDPCAQPEPGLRHRPARPQPPGGLLHAVLRRRQRPRRQRRHRHVRLGRLGRGEPARRGDQPGGPGVLVVHPWRWWRSAYGLRQRRLSRLQSSSRRRCSMKRRSGSWRARASAAR
ncbi:TPA: MFS transporter [Pseudomonas aeruginosa]|nr:MFS transporter [Pseudomonas aeruginosa]